jgi:site-specific DNA recombinase
MRQVVAPVTTRYCLYARKSTESEEMQVLSIDSQIREMLQMAERDNLQIVEIKKESHSAKEAGTRPVFNELVVDIQSGKFNAILTWAPDRISRNAGDLGRIVDLMDAGVLQEIRTYGQKFTNNPNEKFLLMILGSQAKLENDNKVQNVKRGMRARCEMGLYPCVAPTGYQNSKHTDKRCHIEVDPVRAPIIKKIFEKIAYENKTGRQVYFWLRDEVKFKTRTGKQFHLGNLYVALRNHFYYGTFEYPKGSGEWYKGSHEPLISKALFDQVQEKLQQQNSRGGGMQTKEFAFTKLMTCGLCGSGITADEKYKTQKNGVVRRYVYYGCCKSTDRNCKSGYINEEELIEQLAGLMDAIEFNEIGMRQKIKEEIERHKKFQSGLLGIKETKVSVKDVEVRNYAKYILREGQIAEKRELLLCIRSKIRLKNKGIYLD